MIESACRLLVAHTKLWHTYEVSTIGVYVNVKRILENALYLNPILSSESALSELAMNYLGFFNL